ncbi:MAG TPA: cupin domain-containing protein [Polyangiaceae bacterium]|nr:cupin domain-containing protein [Polyangiaceae bacterium]
MRVSPALAGAVLDRLPGLDREAIQVFTPNPAELRSVPPQPGTPEVRSIVRFASIDYRLVSGEWESEAGHHVFKFEYDEWIHILEGEAHVTVRGRTHVLRAGDVAMFRAGLSMIWDIPRYVRKVWVQHYPRRSFLERGAMKLASLW